MIASDPAPRRLFPAMPHDLSLHSGERQTAPDYGAIRADHRLRYEWAAQRIPAGTFGADVFCGNGYGSWLLGESRFVLGIDGSEEAIAQANACYRRPTVLFSAAYFPFSLPAQAFDFVVALESIEHVPDGERFLRELAQSLRPGGTLVFSTPCEERLPHRTSGNRFHARHYTMAQALGLAGAFGLRLVGHAGQDTYAMTPEGRPGGLLPEADMALVADAPGQFLIVHARMGAPA